MRLECRNGHPWIPENLYTHPSCGTICKICRREAVGKFRKNNPRLNLERQEIYRARARWKKLTAQESPQASKMFCI